MTLDEAKKEMVKFVELKTTLRPAFVDPILNAEEVIRCEDCKWWTKQSDSLQGRCELFHHYPTGGWYCANGRREDVQESD